MIFSDTRVCGDAEVFSPSHIFDATSIGENDNPCTFSRIKAESIGVVFEGKYRSLEAFLTLISGWNSRYRVRTEAVVKVAEAHINLSCGGSK